MHFCLAWDLENRVCTKVEIFILHWEVLNQARRVRAKLSASGEDKTTTGWCAINWPLLHSHGHLAVRQSSGQGVKKTRSSHSETGIEGKLSIFRFSPDIFYLSLGRVSHNSPSPLTLCQWRWWWWRNPTYNSSELPGPLEQLLGKLDFMPHGLGAPWGSVMVVRARTSVGHMGWT